jgi:transcription antitermination factor NusG
MPWFVVTSRRQKERTAFDSLITEDFEAYQPRYKEHYYKGRHRRYRIAFLFGRYIFVKFDERWPDVRKVRGICNVLKACATDELPSTISDDVIDEWRKKEKDGFVVGLQEGQLVRARNGVFADQVGRFVGLSNREHDIALFEFLGQPIRVEFQQRGVLVPA